MDEVTETPLEAMTLGPPRTVTGSEALESLR
jgi:hypothetical protein